MNDETDYDFVEDHASLSNDTTTVTGSSNDEASAEQTETVDSSNLDIESLFRELTVPNDSASEATQANGEISIGNSAADTQQSSSTSTERIPIPHSNNGHPGSTPHRVTMALPWPGTITPYTFDSRGVFYTPTSLYAPASPVITVPVADQFAAAFWTPATPGQIANGWNMVAEQANFHLPASTYYTQSDTVPVAPAAAETPTARETAPAPAAEPPVPASETDTESKNSDEWPSLEAAMRETRRNRRSGSGSGSARASPQSSHRRRAWQPFPLGDIADRRPDYGCQDHGGQSR